MKFQKIFEELKTITTNFGIIVRKDILKSQGGYCLLNNNTLIILNKLYPEETHCRILAKCINDLNILNSANYIPPAIRTFIENEISNQETSCPLEIKIQN